MDLKHHGPDMMDLTTLWTWLDVPNKMDLTYGLEIMDLTLWTWQVRLNSILDQTLWTKQDGPNIIKINMMDLKLMTLSRWTWQVGPNIMDLIKMDLTLWTWQDTPNKMDLTRWTLILSYFWHLRTFLPRICCSQQNKERIKCSDSAKITVSGDFANWSESVNF